MSSDDCDTCADHAYRCDVAEQQVRELKSAAQALLDIFKPYGTSNAYLEWEALEDAVKGAAPMTLKEAQEHYNTMVKSIADNMQTRSR
jgi:hypothetical protein